MPLPALMGAAAAVAVGFGFVVLQSGRRVEERRTVLLHVPADRAWEFIRHFPSVYAGHARARGSLAVDRYLLKRGDGVEAGSLWRAEGLWGETPYWADVEIARVIPEKELSVRLVRDSLRTHRGLTDHLGTLSIQADGPGTTKLTWVLRARLRGIRLRSARLIAPERLKKRLLDVGLRSIKVAVEAANAEGAAAGPGRPLSLPRPPLPILEGSPPQPPRRDTV